MGRVFGRRRGGYQVFVLIQYGVRLELSGRDTERVTEAFHRSSSTILGSYPTTSVFLVGRSATTRVGAPRSSR